MSELSISPNRDSILSHLNLLFKNQPSGKIEIAFTSATTGAVNQAEFFNVDEVEKAADFAALKNAKEGCNVYVGAALRQEFTAPFGRSNINDFYAAPALWCDLDDAEAAKTAKDKYKDMKPSFVVVTGRYPDLRAQAWWMLNTLANDKEDIKQALSQSCAALDGDKAVCDPIRVMRLGGTIAWPKKQGRHVEMTEVIIPDGATPSVSLKDFKSYFPAITPLLTKDSGGVVDPLPDMRHSLQSLSVRDEWSTQQICDMLGHIAPDSPYADWVNIGMALKDYGISFDIWDAWSSRGTKYTGIKDTRDKWDSFKGSGTSIGSLYFHAQSGGYHPSKYRQDFVAPQPIEFSNKAPEAFDQVTGEITKSKFKLLYASEVSPTLDANDFVEDLLCENQFSVIYGESNCGKTFFMLDLAMHVAMGLKWRDKHVEQGGVLYCALEGGAGTKNRIYAFKEHHQITADIPLAIIPSSMNLLDPKGDIQDLCLSIKEASDRIGKIKLIVIDTLSRAISGGDENSSMDMGQLVINADYIRAITGAHIAFVHHSGKDSAKGARGHSSLRAAVDTEIEISRPDTISPSTIKVVKQREMEMTEDMAFGLSKVVLGENIRGKEISSCIVLPTSAVEKPKAVKLTNIQTFIYESLVEAVTKTGKNRTVHKDMSPVDCVTYDELREVLEDRGFKQMMADSKKTTAEQIKSATQTARIGLKKQGKANFDSRYIWPIFND